ncbi:MAG: diacylglycerol/lipid kinase family protein [Adlercreutzia sp.]
MKLLIVNNLASGFRDGAIYDFMRAFASDGDEICVRCTDGNTDLADFLRDAENFDAVVAAGGDGTVASVAYLLAETGIPLLPFPAGTANLLAMNLASPAEPHALPISCASSASWFRHQRSSSPTASASDSP